jgi:hypothetical protein
VHVLLCYIYVVYIRNRYFSVMPCGYILLYARDDCIYVLRIMHACGR